MLDRKRYDLYFDNGTTDYQLAVFTKTGSRFPYTEMVEHGKKPIFSTEAMYVMTQWSDSFQQMKSV